MIKGVNKQVVEVRETDSDYFESVLFFVNPKYYGMSEGKLKEKAQTVIRGTGVPPKTKTVYANKFKIIMTFILTAVISAVLTAVLLKII